MLWFDSVVLWLSREHDALMEAQAACVGLQVELKVNTFQAAGVDEALAKGAKQQDPVPSDLWGAEIQVAPQPYAGHHA